MTQAPIGGAPLEPMENHWMLRVWSSHGHATFAPTRNYVDQTFTLRKGFLDLDVPAIFAEVPHLLRESTSGHVS